jgi:hypothetical protein
MAQYEPCSGNLEIWNHLGIPLMNKMAVAGPSGSMLSNIHGSREQKNIENSLTMSQHIPNFVYIKIKVALQYKYPVSPLHRSTA